MDDGPVKVDPETGKLVHSPEAIREINARLEAECNAAPSAAVADESSPAYPGSLLIEYDNAPVEVIAIEDLTDEPVGEDSPGDTDETAGNDDGPDGGTTEF